MAIALKRLPSSVASVSRGPGTKTGGVWKALLDSVARTAEFEKCHLLVIGKRDAGKASLIRALQRVGAGGRTLNDIEIYGETNGVSGLDYAFMNVRGVDDGASETESLSIADVWIVQTIDEGSEMLEPVFRPEMLRLGMVLICLDLSYPWTMKADLKEALDFATDFVQKLLSQLPADEQELLRSRVSKYTSSYRYTVEAHRQNGLNLTEEVSVDNVPGQNQPPLNLGVPIAVVVTKSDSSAFLETRDYPGRSEVILAHLRDICYLYGAAIVYTCTKDALREPLNIVSSDSIFIPAGWDTPAEIQAFADSTIAAGLSKPLELSLPPPPSDEVEVAAEKEEEVPAMSDFLLALSKKYPALLVGEHDESPTTQRSPASHSAQVGASPLGTSGTTARSALRSIKEGVASHGTGNLSTRRTGRSAIVDGVSGESSRVKTRSNAASDKPTNDSDSLRQFFQTLLTKPGHSPGTQRSSTITPDKSQPTKERERE